MIIYRVRRVAAILGLLGTLAGCGVTAEGSARPIDPPHNVRPPATSPPATSPPPTLRAGTVVERLYYVRDGWLVPVVRRLRFPLTAEAHLDLLLAGPTDAEQRAGLTSPVTGPDTVVGLRVRGREAVVDIGDGLAGTGRNDEILAFGQLVHTLTARADIDRVSFWHSGEHVGIPRADGSLSRAPLTAADYAELVSPGG
jgi:hypothetical protein